MVDPFFQKATSSSQQNPQPQQNPQVNAAQQQQNQQQIQQLLQQQQTLQQQYNQYAAALQNPQYTTQQKQQIQLQMQQFSLQYQQISLQLQKLGYTNNHVTKPTTVQKSSGSKISMKGFLIGCFVLLLLVVGGLVAMFYYLIQNPSQLSSVGLDPETTKNLLQVFAVVFFGLLVFLGMALIVVNAYRLISVKNKSKLGYGVGLFLGFIVFLGGIVLGSRILTVIKNLSLDTIVDNSKLVVPYLYAGESGTKPLAAGSTLIAPGVLNYRLNTDYFNAQVFPTLGSATLTDMTLDCGNGQSVVMNMSTAVFDGYCVYFKKGDYTLTLNINYIDTPTGAKNTKSVEAAKLTFASEVTVTPANGELTFNDARTEIIAGKVPSKMRFDASAVFRDFGLANYKVIWNVDGTGAAEKQDASTFTYTYKQAKLYAVSVTFPELDNYSLLFPLRVEQSDVPVCEIAFTQNKGTSYDFNVGLLESTAVVTDYQFSFVDVNDKNKVITTLKNKDGKVSYDFPRGGLYVAKVLFLTDDGKRGECESDDILVGATDFDIKYSFSYKLPGGSNYKKYLGGTGGSVYMEGESIIVNEIPTLILFSVDSISPNDPQAIKSLLYDGKPILSDDNTTFEFKVEDVNEHILTLVVENKTTGAKTERSFVLQGNRNNIIGKLVIKPDTVGTDPFTVTLDASTTTLNDPTDEIVYFSWDFGDGDTKKNLSQSVVQHTYRYDVKKETGTFKPTVTIKTKKGAELLISSPNDIIVKKPVATLKINLESHPAQLARVADRVSANLEISGLPTKIFWDFGNGKTLECNGRECVTTTTVYDTPGSYIIRAQVSYEDRPSVDGSISLKVQ